MDKGSMIQEQVHTEFTLQQLQGWMQQVILPHTTQAGERAQAFEDMRPEYLVHDTQRLNARQHIGIYRQSYIARLRECMRSQFGALAYALGHDLFEMFADQYLDVHPSGSYTLNDLGQHFANFLQETRPDAGSEEKEDWPDFMIELAHFEYALSTTFDKHIADMPYATTETADEELVLSPGVRLFKHSFPVCDYYLAFSQKQEPELPFGQESFCIVVRHDYRLALYNLQPAQYIFLQYLHDGKTITEAMSLLTSTLGYTEQQVASAWAQWKLNFIRSGIFVQ